MTPGISFKQVPLEQELVLPDQRRARACSGTAAVLARCNTSAIAAGSSSCKHPIKRRSISGWYFSPLQFQLTTLLLLITPKLPHACTHSCSRSLQLCGAVCTCMGQLHEYMLPCFCTSVHRYDSHSPSFLHTLHFFLFFAPQHSTHLHPPTPNVLFHNANANRQRPTANVNARHAGAAHSGICLVRTVRL